MTITYDDVPKASHLKPLVLVALRAFGGSATLDPIREYIIDLQGYSEELQAVPYPSDPRRAALRAHLSQALSALNREGKITYDRETRLYAVVSAAGDDGDHLPPPTTSLTTIRMRGRLQYWSDFGSSTKRMVCRLVRHSSGSSSVCFMSTESN